MCWISFVSVSGSSLVVIIKHNGIWFMSLRRFEALSHAFSVIVASVLRGAECPGGLQGCLAFPPPGGSRASGFLRAKRRREIETLFRV